MNIFYFGTYEKDYPRNRIMIKGFRKNGIQVVECHYSLWERQRDKTGGYLTMPSLLGLFVRLVWGYMILIGKFIRSRDFDYLVVGYIGQTDVFLAKLLLLFRRRPLIFNPLVSIYDTLVLDRQVFKQGSILSKILFHIDKWSFQMSDVIVLDTQEQIRYITERFDIDKNKFVRVFVGTDEDVFYPRQEIESKDGLFRVLFYGKFIPLHGIHHILHAAKALEHDSDILFQIIGKGQLSAEIHDLAVKLDLKNVEFIDWVPYERLPEYISKADLCLGIFGDTEKAKRVIPNKVYQALACGKPVITGETPAIRELGELQNLHLCSPPMASNLPLLISDLKENNSQVAACLGELFEVDMEAFDNFLGKVCNRTVQ